MSHRHSMRSVPRFPASLRFFYRHPRPVDFDSLPAIVPDQCRSLIQQLRCNKRGEWLDKSGRYHYRSLVDQTVYPAPAVQNAGRPPGPEPSGRGRANGQSAETMMMTLWNDGSFNPQSGFSVKVENGQTYGRRGQDDWQKIDDVADAFAPGEIRWAF